MVTPDLFDTAFVVILIYSVVDVNIQIHCVDLYTVYHYMGFQCSESYHTEILILIPTPSVFHVCWSRHSTIWILFALFCEQHGRMCTRL